MRGKSKVWLAVLLAGLLLLSESSWAQRSRTRASKSRTQLEREKRTALKRIKETSRILQQTQQRKEATIGQLNALKEKITVQKNVIQTISSELKYLDSDVRQTETQVQHTQHTLAQLRAEYARLIYASSKTANSYNRIMFVFAAESFNQFVRRLQYVRQYAEVRKVQAAQITQTQTRLSQQLTGLTAKRQQKSSLLTTQLSENRNLLSIKTQQDQVVTQLSRQEQQLQAELARRQQSVSRLDNLIAQRVREEIARAARAASRASRPGTASRSNAPVRSPGATRRTETTETEAAADRTDRVTLTPETAVLSSSFADNRGRLLWPVGRGFISQRFGKHPHPVLKHVVVENRGVDIQTNAGEAVRAVFEGKVLTVASVPGMNTIVMVQHGEYFTVYAKLRNVAVSEGQMVEARQQLGTVYTDSEGTSEVQFQLWRNSANLNPENWLGRK